MRVLSGREALLVGVVLLVAVLTIAMFDYAGREELHDAQLRGCERNVADRALNAAGWRIAEAGRRESARLTTGATRENDLRLARRYALIAGGLEERAAIDCKQQYPDPSLFFGVG